MTETTNALSAETAEEADKILAALMERIAPVEDTVTYRKVLVYGLPGVGKTVFSATFPRPLILRVEANGTESLRNHPELLKNATGMEFKSVRQLELLLEKMIEKPEAFEKWDTLVIDSFSELQKNDLDDIVAKAASMDASRNKYLPTGPDYNVNTEHMRQIATLLERLPKHVVLTAHVKEEKDDSTGIILSRPNLTPKLAGTLSGKMDVVGYMAMNGSGDSATRTLQVHPTRQITAKTRVAVPAPVIENPTYDNLFTKD